MHVLKRVKFIFGKRLVKKDNIKCTHIILPLTFDLVLKKKINGSAHKQEGLF